MIVLFLLSVLLFHIFLNISRKQECNLPGPKSYPIIGNALEFLSNDALGVLMRLAEKYGKLFKVTLGSDLYVIMSDPVDVEVILSSTKHNSKALSYKFLSSWLKNGLITSDGEIWHRHRKLLTPSFHFKILENSMNIMDKNSKILVEQLKSQIGKTSFNIQLFIEKCSLDIISESAMGVETNSQISDNNTYLHAVKSVTEISVSRIFKLWLQPEFLFRLSSYSKKFEKSLEIMESVSKNVIASKRKELDDSVSENSLSDADKSKNKKQRIPFLNWMLTESNFTDEEIHSEVMSFLFAGHDTTTSAVSFCIYQLSKYPVVQDKTYQEIMKVLPDDNRCPSIQDLYNLRYMEKVIKETFRLYPPVPMIGRTVHEETHLPSGNKLPANTQVNIFIYLMHRNPKIFKEPEKFIPERFDEEHYHPFTYIPFSAGPRNCIGQKLAMLEIKIVIATLLRSYQLLPANDDKSLTLTTELILRSKQGIPVRLIKRNELSK